jgi:hypothetical protein
LNSSKVSALQSIFSLTTPKSNRQESSPTTVN